MLRCENKDRVKHLGRYSDAVKFKWFNKINIMCIYVFIYIYIYIERERRLLLWQLTVNRKVSLRIARTELIIIIIIFIRCRISCVSGGGGRFVWWLFLYDLIPFKKPTHYSRLSNVAAHVKCVEFENFRAVSVVSGLNQARSERRSVSLLNAERLVSSAWLPAAIPARDEPCFTASRCPPPTAAWNNWPSLILCSAGCVCVY